MTRAAAAMDFLSHQATCKFRRAATCAVGIECEHGRDCCPICDPCTCSPPRTRFERVRGGEDTCATLLLGA